ncbi:unnamed protein product [Phytophthora fragariaefolia]|uniref:Unnamed protein product n=1 Tax=Phytophthora fragariaefolia TaxID=1490495 RepID=A0A9W7CXX2_9STRA|nr:unnamed protein product [Phytophthora fragariaefolia]
MEDQAQAFIRGPQLVQAGASIPEDAKQHDDSITLNKARILEGNRTEASTVEAVHYYYDNLSAPLNELKLHNSPSQIWNCDETSVCTQAASTPKGMAANVQRSADLENVNIMGCIIAAGDLHPPLYIFARCHKKAEWMQNAPNGAVCAMSDTSNLNISLFMQWLKWFVGKSPPARPQLLILDWHFAHIDCNVVLSHCRLQGGEARVVAVHSCF